jgi:hypothetical protein
VKLRRRPPPEPLSDADFERLIEVYVLRGWTLKSRTQNTAVMVFEEVDKLAILAGFGSDHLLHTPTKRTRKVLTRQTPMPWLTPEERRQLGEVE